MSYIKVAEGFTVHVSENGNARFELYTYDTFGEEQPFAACELLMEDVPAFVAILKSYRIEDIAEKRGRADLQFPPKPGTSGSVEE